MALFVAGGCACFTSFRSLADENVGSPIPMVNPATLEDGVLKWQFDALSGEARDNAVKNLGAEPLSNLPWLQLDSCGGIVRPDPPGQPPPKAPSSISGTAVARSALSPLGDTFLLHSRSNSPHKIFLDFDGHTTVNTMHNWQYNGGAPIVSAAFDAAGNGSPFSDGEKEIIQYIWQIVAEDFAPFDVDVTTQEPPLDDLRRTSTDDNRFGMRVVISPTYQWFGPYGGFAYLDSFTWASDTPCFVFSCFLYTIEQWANCVGHETGHTFGSPDFNGAGGYYSGHDSATGGWAPIMGTSYYEPVSQWTRGDYYGSSTHYDMLAAISVVVGYCPDDHGDTWETATLLAATNYGNVSTRGLVEKTEELDFFSLLCGEGPVHLDFLTSRAAQNGKGANLDIIARLYDESGTLVFTSDNPTSLCTTLDYEVTRGTWYVSVSGTGSGNPSNNPPTGYTSYGSLGPYSMTGSVPEYVLSMPSVNNDAGAVGLFGARPSATLRAALSNSSARVFLYWGTTDGGADPAAWQNVANLGVRIPGQVSTNMFGVLYGIRYYYRFFASNMVGTAWAPSSANFVLARPPDPNLPVAGGLALWLDAAHAGSLTNGQQAGTWPDLSGRNNHAVRAAASAAGYPQFRTNELNGLPAMRFDVGGDSWFDFRSMGNIRTVFWTLRERMPGQHCLLGDDTMENFARDDSTNYSIWGSADASSNVLNGVTKLMGNAVTGTSTRLGSGYRIVSLVTAGNVEACRVSQDRNHTDRSWDGEMAEIVIYDRALDPDEESQVGSYLTEKYSLATAYPAMAPRSCEISNMVASGITATSAVLNARLKGRDSWFRVRTFWGTADGGTNPAAWQNSGFIGDYANVAYSNLSLQVVPPQTNMIYVFRFSASNLAEQLWSPAAFPFACPVMTKTIDASAGVGGSISPSGAMQVAVGGSQAFSIVPSTGCRIFDVKEDGVSKGAVSSYCINNIMTNHSVSASFAVITNTITASVAGGVGSISPSGGVEVAYGASQTFNIASNMGYRIGDVVVDGASVGTPVSYTFSNVTSGHSISVYFARVTNIVTASTGIGGSIAPLGSVQVPSGISQTFTISAFSGYRIADVLVDGVSAGAVSSYSFTNVTCDHTIASYFAVITNTITATSGQGGSISPSGAVQVAYGGSQTFVFPSNTGYCVADVVVDGSSVGARQSYAIANVTSNRSISVVFAVITNTITATAGEGGSITPSGLVRVPFGGSQTFNMASNTGYNLTNVLVDGVPQGVITTYSFSNVTAPHTITALLEAHRFTITASASPGGTISPSGAVSVAYGSSPVFYITPALGYSISNVAVDGISQGAVPSYTFANITNAHSISAVFFASGYPVTATAGLGGSITPSGAVYVTCVETTTFRVAASAGHELIGLYVDGMGQGVVTSYTFYNVSSPRTISAVFAVITNIINASASAGGSITPSGVVRVAYGASQAFSMVPADGCYLSNVVVDGIAAGAVTSYQFTNVTGNRSITALFVSFSSAVRYDGDGTADAWCELQRWLINRARFNPEAEADRLGLVNAAAGGHPAYDACEDTAGSNDFGASPAEWGQWTASKQPLAFNAMMIGAASNHCVDMLGVYAPQYETPGGSARYTPGWTCVERQAFEGYSNSLGGRLENVACNGSWDVGAEYPESGPPPEGWHDGAFIALQDESRAQRRGILSTDARETGIGYVRTDIGGFILEFCAEDYGKQGASRFFTDTLFHDADADNVYDIGEGIGGVEIRLYDGGMEAGWYDVSGPAGSFAVPTTGLAAGHRIDVVLVNKTGSPRTITIPNGYAASVEVNIDAGQSATVGSYIQGSLNTGFRNMETTFEDGDSDGMCDSWEMRHFLATNAVNGGATNDWDGDGLGNLKEYIAGTDPTNAASRLVLGIRWLSNAVQVTVNTVLTTEADYGTVLRHYKIEEASCVTGNWAEAAGYTDFTASGGPRILTNSASPSAFYRARVWLAP